MPKFLLRVFAICIIFINFSVLAESLDKVVAVVNSAVITQSQLNAQMKIARSQMMGSNGPKLSESALRKAVLDQLIDNALQLELAKKAGINISQSDVDGVIAKIAAQNNMPVSALYQGVASQGMSKSVYREQIRQQMIIHTIQQKALGSQIKVTSQDLANASTFARSAPASSPATYSQYHVVDILLPTQSDADNFLSQLKSGSSAQTLTQNNPQAKVEDLGLRPLAELPGVFQDTVQSLKKGQFSPVIKAPNGFHILQLVDVSGKRMNASNGPAMSAEQMAFQHKYNEALQQWLQKLRSQAYVKVMND